MPGRGDEAGPSPERSGIRSNRSSSIGLSMILAENTNDDDGNATASVEDEYGPRWPGREKKDVSTPGNNEDESKSTGTDRHSASSKGNW